MNDFGLGAMASTNYEQLSAIVDLKDSRLLAQDFRWYKQLKVVVDMNDSKSWAQVSRLYE